MAESTRKSRMAIVEESVADTLQAPTTGTDYLALQNGFSLTPNFAVLENEELKGSIAQSKTITGLEEPEASLSHYMYNSGVVATAPEQNLLIKNVFGDEDIASTEYDVVSSTAGTGSAAATITVGGGEGATFQRGEALLIKDSTNGYTIRPIESIATDTLTLGFNLPGAPAATTLLGRAVCYTATDDLGSLSVWDYRGNSGAVQAMSGARVSEMTIEASAGEFLNSSFSMQGTSFYFNPIEITATTDSLDFDDGAPQSLTLPVGFYRDPIDAASALESAFNAASTDTFTVTYSNTTGLFTVTTDGASLDIDWATTANTLGAAFGFTADDTGALTYTSDVAIGLESPQTPVLDGSNPLVAKSNTVFLGDFADNVCFPAQTITVTVSKELANVLSFCADSGVAEKVIGSGGRTVTASISATLDRYDADKFKRFRTNETTRFMWNFGEKEGGNWVAGKCGCFYMPTCTISSFELTDNDGIVTVDMELTGFTVSGEAEVFLNFV